MIVEPTALIARAELHAREEGRVEQWIIDNPRKLAAINDALDERDRKLAAVLEKNFRALDKAEQWRDDCQNDFEHKISEVPMVWEQWHFVYDVPEAELVRLDAPRLAAEMDVRRLRKIVIEAMAAALRLHPYAPGDTFSALCFAEEAVSKAKAACAGINREAEGFRRLHALHIVQSNLAEIARRYKTKTFTPPTTEIDGQIFPVTRTKGRKRKVSK